MRWPGLLGLRSSPHERLRPDGRGYVYGRPESVRVGHAGPVTDVPRLPDAEELERLGLYDPGAGDAPDRLELIRYVMARGATVEDVAASKNLGELALDMNLRPRVGTTLGEVVEASGIEWSKAQRLLTALGLSTDPEVLTTAGEADAVRLIAMVSNDLLGDEATMQLARVAGNAMARVAETLVGVFRLQVELPRRDAGTRYVEVVMDYADMAQTLLPAFVGTLDALLRRQIVAVADRMWSTDVERSAVTLPRTVGFVDLVGYTEATAALSVRQLTEVLIDFDNRTADVAARRNGQIVKTIGDEAMFVTEDAADACHIALDLVGAAGGELPPVRVGLASGEMISVLGDLYGPDVNLAARLVAVADPGTAVVSEQVRMAAPSSIRFERLAPLTLKGFSTPVDAYRIHR
jgi:adenylate cyclase